VDTGELFDCVHGLGDDEVGEGTTGDPLLQLGGGAGLDLDP
jgi:hypothetical protein